MLEYVLLGFLKDCDASGYKIKQRMAESTAHFVDASFGSIYPALKKMEAKGSIIVRDVVEGGKLKRIYSITKSGEEEFMEWLQKPIVLTKSRPDPLVQLFFYGYLTKDKAMENISLFITEIHKALKELKSIEPHVKEKANAYQYATLVYGIGHYEFVIKFCNDLIFNIKGEGK